MSLPRRAVSLLLALLAPTLLGAAERTGKPAPTLRIVNARLIDGTGAPARRGSLRIAGERIVAVGDVAPIPGERRGSTSRPTSTRISTGIRLATGIERVWVNGQPVFAGGAATGLKPGRVLRRERSPG